MRHNAKNACRNGMWRLGLNVMKLKVLVACMLLANRFAAANFDILPQNSWNRLFQNVFFKIFFFKRKIFFDFTDDLGVLKPSVFLWISQRRHFFVHQQLFNSRNVVLSSISPKFNEQLLWAKIPKAQKSCLTWLSILRFWDLRA